MVDRERDTESVLGMALLSDLMVANLPPKAEKAAGSFLTCIDGHELAGLSVHGRVPAHELDDVVAQSWAFPEAAAVAQQHCAHLVVAAKPATDDVAGRRAAAIAVSRYLASVPADAVYIPSAGVLSSPLSLREAFEATDAAAPPTDIWVSVSLHRLPTGGVRAVSRGLATFVGYEIAVQDLGDGRMEAAAAYGLANWILTCAPAIADGDDVGIPDGPTLLARRLGDTIHFAPQAR